MEADQGADVETAITLEATCSEEAVRMENEHITERYGTRGMEWDRVAQSLVKRGDRYFDAVVIEKGGRRSVIYFDVSTVWAGGMGVRRRVGRK